MNRAVQTLFHETYEIELQFYLTERCDLACRGCYMNASPAAAPDQLPAEHVLQILKAFGKLDGFNNTVAFTGGEARLIGTGKLGGILQSTLDMGVAAELKTNMAWVPNPKKSGEMFDMLSNLKVPWSIHITTEAEFTNYIRKLVTENPGATKEEIIKKCDAEYPPAPMLTLAGSVDNLIHPAKSAEWFATLAKRIATDEKLRNNMNLGVSVFNDSFDWFLDTVIKNPELGCRDFNRRGNRFGFSIDGYKIVGLRDKFLNPKDPEDPEDMWRVVFNGGKKGIGRLVLYFYPDQTVGFETHGLHSVARVPYLTRNGKVKDWNTMANDMLIQLMNDYMAAVK